MLKKLGLALGLSLFSMSAFGQQWPNLPQLDSASYCSSTVNNVCVQTIPAGPAKTGLETVPMDTNAASGQTPQTVKAGLADFNALPVSVVVVTTPPSGISAANTSGGVLYTSTTTITSANITLPLNPIDKQQYRVSSNQTITTLFVNAPAGTSMGTNVAPTVLTASTTVPQGYTFMYNLADTKWYRLQ